MSATEDKANLPLVSVIIPTYNSERTLGKCLESIVNQTYPHIEIIVVDGGSKDNTVNIAKKYGARVFVLEGEERSASINYGVKMARGKYIYRVDSDVILDPRLIEECVYKCETEGYDALSIMWLPDTSISFWAKVRRLEKECYYKHRDTRRITARFIRKDVFEKVGGFDPNLVAGEDYDLQNRLLEAGYSIGFATHVETHIGEPRSVRDIVRKNYYYGKTIVNFIRKNTSEGVRQVSPIRGSLLKCWRDFMFNPLLTFGFLMYYLIVYLSTLTGMLSSILVPKLDK